MNVKIEVVNNLKATLTLANVMSYAPADNTNKIITPRGGYTFVNQIFLSAVVNGVTYNNWSSQPADPSSTDFQATQLPLAIKALGLNLQKEACLAQIGKGVIYTADASQSLPFSYTCAPLGGFLNLTIVFKGSGSKSPGSSHSNKKTTLYIIIGVAAGVLILSLALYFYFKSHKKTSSDGKSSS